MFGLGSQELLLVLVIALVLFGGSRLPRLARALGRSVREFKKGVHAGLDAKDDKDHHDKDGAAPR